MLDAALERALFNRPPIWATGAGDWWDFTRSGRAKRGVGAMPVETRGSDGWVENEAGVLVKRSANTRSMAGKGLLTYPTAQNFVSAPSDFSNVFWGLDNVTIVADQARNFDGSMTMDKIVETTANAAHHARNYAMVTATAGTWYVAYGYARAAERGFLRVNPAGSGSPIGGTNTFYNLSTGVVTQGGNPDVVGSMRPMADGLWYCECAVKAASSAGLGFQLAPAPDNSQINYVGDASKGIYLGGWNFRAGQFGVPPIDSAATANGPQQVIDIGSRAALGFGFALQVDLRGLATSSCSVFDVNDGSVSNRFTIYSLSGNFRHALGKAGIYDASEPIIAAASTGLATFYGAVGPGYRNVRMVGQADPGADLSTDYPSTLSRVSPLGQGYSAANNSFGYAKRLALWYGPMSAYFMDNVIGPRAQIMQQQAA